MITTVEISMYPLREHFVPAIDGLIALLEKRATEEDFKMVVQPTCTLVCGPFDVVLKAVHESIAATHQQFGQAVYVTKILPDYRGI